MWALAGWLVWNLLKKAVINLNCVLCRSPKDMNLSQKRTPKWSQSWSSMFMTTGRATASPFPPWWSELFSSWWGDLIQQHKDTNQTCLHLMTKVTAQMIWCLQIPMKRFCVTSLYYSVTMSALSTQSNGFIPSGWTFHTACVCVFIDNCYWLTLKCSNIWRFNGKVAILIFKKSAPNLFCAFQSKFPSF